MKISRDTGRKENLAAFTAWVVFIIIYFCAISFLLRGYIISSRFSILEDLGSIAIIVVSVILALLTVRLLFRVYLRMKAYHVREGTAWREWSEKKEHSFRDREMF